MDWEDKFSSILREAESNLSKTRRKINSSRYNDKQCTFSTSLPMRRTSSLLEFPRSDLFSSVYTPHHTTEHVGTSSGLVSVLNDRLEEQNRLIDQLRQMVSKLETDRNKYGEQIRELKNEMYKLRGKEGPNVDRKLDQVRHDLNEDIQILNSQLQQLRSAGGNRLSDNHYVSLSRDVQEVKHSFREDMDTIKRDMDTVKSRLFKMELDVASAFNNGKDLQRKQQRLDQNVHDLATQHKQPNRTPQGNWSPASDSERLHMSELRSTMSLLKDRLGNIEAVVNSQQSTPRYSTPIMQNGYSSQPKYKSPTKKHKKVYTTPKIDIDIDSDEFLLSDDDASSDLEIFNPNKQKGQGLDSDDDLDLDDLDLDDEMGSLDSELNDL